MTEQVFDPTAKMPTAWHLASA